MECYICGKELKKREIARIVIEEIVSVIIMAYPLSNGDCEKCRKARKEAVEIVKKRIRKKKREEYRKEEIRRRKAQKEIRKNRVKHFLKEGG